MTPQQAVEIAFKRVVDSPSEIRYFRVMEESNNIYGGAVPPEIFWSEVYRLAKELERFLCSKN